MSLSAVQRAFLSAGIGFLIASGGAIVSLLTEAQSFSDINGPAYAVAVITGIIVAAKDIQSRLGPHLDHPRKDDGSSP